MEDESQEEKQGKEEREQKEEEEEEEVVLSGENDDEASSIVDEFKKLDIEAPLDEEESIDSLLARADAWYELWCRNQQAPAETEIDALIRMRRLFGAQNDDEVIANETLEYKYVSIMYNCTLLFKKLGDHGLADCSANGSAESRTRYGHMLKVMENIWYTFNTLMCIGHVRLINNTRSQALLPDHLLSVRYCPPDFGNVNKYQQLLLFYLSKAREHNYRKVGSTVYEPIMCEGKFTHSWQAKMEIEEFVYSAVHPKEHYSEQWKCLSDKNGNGKAAALYLQHAYDSDFPFLKRDKKLLGFKNGVYDVGKDRFYLFGDPALRADMATAKYFPTEFENALYEEILQTCTSPTCPAFQRRTKQQDKDLASDFQGLDLNNNDVKNNTDKTATAESDDDCTCKDDYMKLPTPAVQGIFDHQGLSTNVCRWIYALIGRLFFDVNERDWWQVQLFIKGVAGTGKSCLLRLCENLFDPQDVGFFGNNVEKGYPLQGIVGKFIYLAMDIHRGFQLDQYVWQNMVTGEGVNVARKHLSPLMLNWKSHGIFAGNAIMDWDDNCGSVSRRLVVVEFARMVKHGDPKLFSKMKKEIAIFVKKCIVAYLSMVENYARDLIWSVLPDELKQSQKELQKQTNALEGFVTCDEMVLHPDVSMPWRLFKEAFDLYCEKEKKNKATLDTDYYSLVFQKRDLHIEPGIHDYRGETFDEKFIIGIDIRANRKADS